MLLRLPILPFAVSITALVLLAGTGCRPQQASLPEGLNELGVAFREANQAPTIDPMLGLYHLEGVDERTTNLLRSALEFELGLPIAGISFEPLSGAPEETIYFTHKGETYGPSLKPAYRMRVSYDVEDGLTSLFTIGRTKDGNWRIVSARPEPTPEF